MPPESTSDHPPSLQDADSPPFPFITATSSSSSRRRAALVRMLVAPAPTGSRMTGMECSFALRPAMSIASTCSFLKVPMLSTRAPAIDTISSTSSLASAMTGEAPMHSVMLAQSFTVT